MLEQNLLLNRKNEATNEYFVNYRSLVKDSRLYICTTMYHEESYEMEQLLNSLGGIDCARKEAGRKFESHIFFDDGVRDKTLKKYALQLVSLVERTLDIKPSFAKKIMTPYGMKLQWKLPGGMDFHIHLKDNYKVTFYCYSSCSQLLQGGIPSKKGGDALRINCSQLLQGGIPPKKGGDALRINCSQLLQGDIPPKK